MYNHVNFLKERNRLQELYILRDKKIASYSVGFLSIFIFILIIVIAFGVYQKKRLDDILALQKFSLQKITQMKDAQSTFLRVQKKAQSVSQIFASRGNQWEAIAFFYSILPAGSNITSVDLQGGVKNSLLFSITSSTIFAYNQLAQVIQSQNTLDGGYEVTFGALTRGRDGSYRVEVSVNSRKI